MEGTSLDDCVDALTFYSSIHLLHIGSEVTSNGAWVNESIQLSGSTNTQ